MFMYFVRASLARPLLCKFIDNWLTTLKSHPSSGVSKVSDLKALSIQNLYKTYKNKIQALKNVSFDVQQGDFFALLGPNGAGKSTVIGILTSLVQKTDGQVKILGHDIDREFEAAKACLGVVPQEFNFNIFEKVIMIILNQAGYYGIPRKEALFRAEKYLKQLDLWDRRHETARNLSGGMKRRLMIARALIHEPKILVLDEPTAGVDIEIRRSMWKFLLELNQQGVTIILTTHYLEEAESLCRHLAIIDHGEIIENTEMSELLNRLEKESFILYLQYPYPSLPKLAGYQIKALDDRTLEVDVPRDLGVSDLFDHLKEHGIIVSSLRNKVNRLEELFIQLTQRERNDDEL